MWLSNLVKYTLYLVTRLSDTLIKMFINEKNLFSTFVIIFKIIEIRLWQIEYPTKRILVVGLQVELHRKGDRRIIDSR